MRGVCRRIHAAAVAQRLSDGTGRVRRNHRRARRAAVARRVPHALQRCIAAQIALATRAGEQRTNETREHQPETRRDSHAPQRVAESRVRLIGDCSDASAIARVGRGKFRARRDRFRPARHLRARTPTSSPDSGFRVVRTKLVRGGQLARGALNIRASSPLASSFSRSSNPPMNVPSMKIIGNVGQPVHILSTSRGFHWLK